MVSGIGEVGVRIGEKIAMTKSKKKEPRRKWVQVPVPPTKEMLTGMSEATFLTDGSNLEMERRFNGMIGTPSDEAKLACLATDAFSSDAFSRQEERLWMEGYDAGAAAERARAAELAQALDGCPHCDYDEAEGGLVNHCDACCRKVTTLAWAQSKEQEVK